MTTKNLQTHLAVDVPAPAPVQSIFQSINESEQAGGVSRLSVSVHEWF